MRATGSQEEKAETEERIFRAALDVFAMKGKDGARMQEIADLAGINKAMLHYYFRSKEKLYEAVFEYVFNRFSVREIQATLEDAKNYRETLRAFINGFIEIHQNDPAVMRLMVNENLAGGTTMGKIISKASHESSAPSLFVRKTMQAVARGEIRAIDPHHLVLTIISSCLFFLIWEPTIKIKHATAAGDWDTFVEARKLHIFDLLYHGLAVEGNGPHSVNADEEKK